MRLCGIILRETAGACIRTSFICYISENNSPKLFTCAHCPLLASRCIRGATEPAAVVWSNIEADLKIIISPLQTLFRLSFVIAGVSVISSLRGNTILKQQFPRCFSWLSEHSSPHCELAPSINMFKDAPKTKPRVITLHHLGGLSSLFFSNRFLNFSQKSSFSGQDIIGRLQFMRIGRAAVQWELMKSIYVAPLWVIGSGKGGGGGGASNSLPCNRGSRRIIVSAASTKLEEGRSKYRIAAEPLFFSTFRMLNIIHYHLMIENKLETERGVCVPDGQNQLIKHNYSTVKPEHAVDCQTIWFPYEGASPPAHCYALVQLSPGQQPDLPHHCPNVRPHAPQWGRRRSPGSWCRAKCRWKSRQSTVRPVIYEPIRAAEVNSDSLGVYLHLWQIYAQVSRPWRDCGEAPEERWSSGTTCREQE